MKYTPADDAASADLNVAYEAMQKVGGFINEAKKRKDLVEKIVLQKKSVRGPVAFILRLLIFV